jgi:hypothetical protein
VFRQDISAGGGGAGTSASGLDLRHLPASTGTAAICAHRTVKVDVLQGSQIADLDASVGRRPVIARVVTANEGTEPVSAPWRRLPAISRGARAEKWRPRWNDGVAGEVTAPAHCRVMHAGGGVLALYALAGIGITAASRATRSGGDTSDVRMARRTRGAMGRDAVERTGPAGRAGLKYALEWTASVGKGQARALCGLLRRAADSVREVHQVEKREKRQSKRGKRSRPHQSSLQETHSIPLIARPMSRTASQTTTPAQTGRSNRPNSVQTMKRSRDRQFKARFRRAELYGSPSRMTALCAFPPKTGVAHSRSRQ